MSNLPTYTADDFADRLCDTILVGPDGTRIYCRARSNGRTDGQGFYYGTCARGHEVEFDLND